jgi:hypothetical protein
MTTRGPKLVSLYPSQHTKSLILSFFLPFSFSYSVFANSALIPIKWIFSRAALQWHRRGELQAKLVEASTSTKVAKQTKGAIRARDFSMQIASP